jgi:hypothetical protein
MPPEIEKSSTPQASATKSNGGDTQLAAGLEQFTVAAMKQNWLHRGLAKLGEKRISANETTALAALVAHVSYRTEISEFRVERELADRFNVPNMKCLPASSFDAAIRYLVDRVPGSQL